MQNYQPYAYPPTVGTTAVQVLPVDPLRKRLVFINPNASAVIYVCPATNRVDSSSITCAENGAGAIPIFPGGSLTINRVGGNPYTIPSAWNAVASADGSKLTILEGE